MTTIYFIRQATPDRTKGEDSTFPLSEKGQADIPLVTAYLHDKAIAIGTHGTALGTIILHYDSSYSFDEWMVMPMPWVVKMTFDRNVFKSIEKIDLFAQNEVNHV